MNTNYTAIIKQDGNDWLGWIEEVTGVNCQEKTQEALMETLKITIRETIEFNRQDAISEAKANYIEELVCV